MNNNLVLSVAAGYRTDARLRLTVGIPTWNRCNALQAQIARILPHLSAEDELLVCDNASSDGTWALLSEMVRSTGASVRCLRNGVNLGADVNYLRVMEAARGDWLWLIGDDDAIDFQKALPAIFASISIARSDMLIILDRPGSNSDNPQPLTSYAADSFFNHELDEVGIQILQLGRVVSRRSHHILKSAYSRGVGTLHAYAIVYGALVQARGVDVLHISLMREQVESNPRWDILQGHLGAWNAGLAMFPDQAPLVNRREIRLRRGALRGGVLQRLVNGRAFSRGELAQLCHKLPWSDFGLICILIGIFRLHSGFANALLSRLKPDFMKKIVAAADNQQLNY